MKIRINWNYLPFLKGVFLIKDLWHHEEIGRTDVNFVAEIPSHDVVMLRLAPIS